MKKLEDRGEAIRSLLTKDIGWPHVGISFENVLVEFHNGWRVSKIGWEFLREWKRMGHAVFVTTDLDPEVVAGWLVDHQLKAYVQQVVRRRRLEEDPKMELVLE